MRELFIEEIIERTSDNDNTSEDGELLETWLENCLQYICRYEKFESK